MLSPRSVLTTSVIASLVALGPLSTDMYLPAFPALMRAFSADIDEVQQTLSVFLIGFALAQLVYGPLSDRFGRKLAISRKENAVSFGAILSHAQRARIIIYNYYLAI